MDICFYYYFTSQSKLNFNQEWEKFMENFYWPRFEFRGVQLSPKTC